MSDARFPRPHLTRMIPASETPERTPMGTIIAWATALSVVFAVVAYSAELILAEAREQADRDFETANP